MLRTQNYEKNIAAMSGGAYRDLKERLAKIKGELAFEYEFDRFESLNVNIKISLKDLQKAIESNANDFLKVQEEKQKDGTRKSKADDKTRSKDYEAQDKKKNSQNSVNLMANSSQKFTKTQKNSQNQNAKNSQEFANSQNAKNSKNSQKNSQNFANSQPNAPTHNQNTTTHKLNTQNSTQAIRLYSPQSPFEHLKTALEPYQKDFARYPYFFFYGIGNGIFYKTLAQNPTHQHIIIIEPCLELIYMALNLCDFSQELAAGRIIIIYSPTYDTFTARFLFIMKGIFGLYKIYNFFIHSPFYEEHFEADIKRVAALNIHIIRTTTMSKGNDPADALMGIEHALINLPVMLTRPSIVPIIKRGKKSRFAILVATGPSLSKQLPTLKKYADKATIISADSSYSILYEAGIKPDFVLSLERVEPTARFFDTDFGEFDKDIIFLLYCLTHPKSTQNLLKRKKYFIMTQRGQSFTRYLELNEYGYIDGGMSVMNMAYNFALLLGFKDIILIGQDLAYSNTGESHPKNYMYKQKVNFDSTKLPKATAYGGVGEVFTTDTWTLFRSIFETSIAANKKSIRTYNATQGGARIEGAIEKPFLELCEKFLAKAKTKGRYIKPKKPSRTKSSENMLKSYEKIKAGQHFLRNYIKAAKRTQKKLETLIYGKQKYTLNAINADIDALKRRMGGKKLKKIELFVNEMLYPAFAQQEDQLSLLFAKNFENETERQNKLLAWIYAHEAWVEELVDLLEVYEKSLKKNIVPLRDVLEKLGIL